MLDNDNEKFLLPMDYGANDENTLKMGMRQQSPMKPALSNKYVKEHHLIAMGLGPAGSMLRRVSETV